MIFYVEMLFLPFESPPCSPGPKALNGGHLQPPITPKEGKGGVGLFRETSQRPQMKHFSKPE